MEVKVRSKWGELRFGEAFFSPDRHKASVNVSFKDRPLVLGYPSMGMASSSEEFRLTTGCRVIWGQGVDEDIDDWVLDQKDRESIIRDGGG